MSITLATPQSEMQAYINRRVSQWRKAMVYALQYVGEQVLTVARESHTYVDRTGNLTASMGYAVVVDGEIQNASSAGRGQGAAKSEEFLNELVAKAPKGVVLIVVAGMEYAAYVSARSYDVLDSAEMLAERLVPEMLRQLKLKP